MIKYYVGSQTIVSAFNQDGVKKTYWVNPPKCDPIVVSCSSNNKVFDYG